MSAVAPLFAERFAERQLSFARDLPANDTAPEMGWKRRALAGRIVELHARGASASLTLAFRLVLDAQAEGEPVAWVTTAARTFYPPDAAASGVDLRALAVVRVAESSDIPRAADHLARSGSFGLLVLDLPRHARVPAPLASRLLGLAQKHAMAVLCLTESAASASSSATSTSAPGGASSLGSLVSLRAETTLRHHRRGAFTCTLRAVKDKRQAPGWVYEEVCRGPVGMR
ncbi:MAG: hypothetical protein R3A78_16465 [Polyangiales bacterium]|nr:recombinase A [Myxococcales bacterium]